MPTPPPRYALLPHRCRHAAAHLTPITPDYFVWLSDCRHADAAYYSACRGITLMPPDAATLCAFRCDGAPPLRQELICPRSVRCQCSADGASGVIDTRDMLRRARGEYITALPYAAPQACRDVDAAHLMRYFTFSRRRC